MARQLAEKCTSPRPVNVYGVKLVLAGNCGPNAYQTLSAAGIEIVVGCSGRVREVVEQFILGRFSAAGEPNVASHFGTGAPASDTPVPPPQQAPRTGMGMERGSGIGMGRGGGMGMGRGIRMGRGMGAGGGGAQSPESLPASTNETFSEMSKEQKLRILKEQADAGNPRAYQPDKIGNRRSVAYPPERLSTRKEKCHDKNTPAG
ncbi:MAG: NifB/NifX family molybdenum-iron cluster-binding protein [Pirellulales bacterium]|nr:NifB/NifX family molybdenum-iron cluster-binding protein [Pirellulales bacterium]